MKFGNSTITLVGGDQVVLTKEMVMKSAAGYYIGRFCLTTDSKDKNAIGCIEPYDRLGGYYKTRKAAEKELI